MAPDLQHGTAPAFLAELLIPGNVSCADELLRTKGVRDNGIVTEGREGLRNQNQKVTRYMSKKRLRWNRTGEAGLLNTINMDSDYIL